MNHPTFSLGALALTSLFTLGLAQAPAAEAQLSSGDGTLAEVLSGDDDFSTLIAAVEFAGLTAALADPEAELTVLAPTNRAFERTLSSLGLTAADLLTEENKGLLTDILLYHVVPGVAPSSVVRTLDGAEVVSLQGDEIDINVIWGRLIQLNGTTYVSDADNYASNGVAHVITSVLLPPSIFGSDGTLMDRLSRDSRYSTLVAALEFTGLDAALDDPDAALTLLAPDNRAFDRSLRDLGLSVAELLTEENKGLLTSILLYHVLDGELRASDVRAAVGGSVPTLQGESIDIGLRFGRFLIINDSAYVTRTDVDATNGVTHQLTRVLLPPSLGL